MAFILPVAGSPPVTPLREAEAVTVTCQPADQASYFTPEHGIPEYPLSQKSWPATAGPSPLIYFYHS